MEAQGTCPLEFDTLHYPIIRPREIFTYPHFVDEHPLPEDSWFERVGRHYLGVIKTAPNIALTRVVSASMLFEAYNKYAFHFQFGNLDPDFQTNPDAPDESDRKYYIAWIQHFATLVGLLTYEEVVEIQKLAKSYQNGIGFLQNSTFLPDKFKFVPKYPREIDFSYPGAVAESVRQKALGKRIIIFHGSFDPPHFGHLLTGNYFWMLGDHFIWAIDSDAYIQRYKVLGRDPERKSYSEQERLTILNYYPHLFDRLCILPISQFSDDKVIKVYQELQVDGVCLTSYGPKEIFERRLRQIKASGAVPLVENFSHLNPIYSSTALMELVRLGKSFGPVEVFH